MTTPHTHHGHTPSALLTALLTTIMHSIIPLTTDAVARGCKVFGASILHKSTLLPVISSTNDEMTSPLLHGEVATLLAFHRHNAALPVAQRVDPKQCIFVSTHEPCSLCLSAITWSGFDNFYFLFTYQDTADVFDIPHDIRILHEVFQTNGGQGELYNRKNAYWECWSCAQLVEQAEAGERERLREEVQRVKEAYNALSQTYQASKADQTGQIPLN
ncbi:conserved hypothetical protein [Sporisorium reilianum SRZ2]|uniref:CMP/dCMP-type deaminase domain-containing protein n=1 Tax=Sporisorium reilianum (strain SRZ2) TaxID=999809 RepID=E7A007_SPORE|nr:conserved hypothetical protein [Sporisorium reilianum SRZ2]